MRDTVTAPGLSGEASGCGGVVDTTGVALGPHWARDSDGRPTKSPTRRLAIARFLASCCGA